MLPEPVSKRSERRQITRGRSGGSAAYTSVCEHSEHRPRV